MAGENILVVDDNAINLKLAAAVLRSDGYRVLLASTAEQALMMLRTTVPDLLLVDIQLPGMNGLELTRRVRQESRTKDIQVVALTANVMLGSEQAAYDAGCDGFLSKPIDTRTLPARLRNFLDGPTVPDSAIAHSEATGGLSLEGPEMESMRRTFLVNGLRQVRRMAEFAGPDIDIGAAMRQFHQWVGSAGALGYLEIAERSRAAEMVLDRPGWSKPELEDALKRLANAFASPREAAETVIPDAIAWELERKRIALVGFADEEADRVCLAFEKVRALARLFPPDVPPDSDAIRDCSVVMVHVRDETRDTPWLRADFVLRQRLVLVGRRDDLLSLPPEVQSRACEFLIDGWQPEEVVMRLSFAISRAIQTPTGKSNPEEQAAERLNVLIADDDVHVRAVVRNALESAGMECRTASGGTEAMEMILDHCPHAAVLDVNMPRMDGFEVLDRIRQAKLTMKVVLLTARQQEHDVLRGFQLGADDYVVKPFNPLELAARVARLAGRRLGPA